jgi:hypothetical protein
VRAAALVFVVTAGAWAGAASAAPQVEIKAHTELMLGRARVTDAGTIEVSGRLVDKLTGDGIGSQRVQVGVDGLAVQVRTADDGSFTATFPAADGAVAINLHYNGATMADAAQLSITADPAKQTVTLSLVKLHDTEDGAQLRVDAASEDGPLAGSVELAFAHADRDDWKPFGTTPTGQPFTLYRKTVGGPGNYRVRATYAGNTAQQRAVVEQAVELTAGSTTTMTVRTAEVAYEDELVATGKVVDQDGKPLARAAVTLGAGDRRLAQGVTAIDGTFAFHVEAKLMTVGDRSPWQVSVQAQADPITPSVTASRSSPVTITIAAPHPVPVSYTIAAFAATVLAAGGFLAARSKPWLRLRRPVAPAEAEPDAETNRAIDAGGLVVAKPGMMSTLRRANDDGFAGVVRDSVRSRAVGDAIVRAMLGEREREVRVAADGSFTIENLEQGDWRVDVAAPGHITEHFVITVPHRGELRGVRVDLVPVRERVFQLYRRAAEPVLPEPRLWGVWSPRQIVDHVRGKRPSPALAELTDFVEEIYFSPRLAAETVVPKASERVDLAIQERVRFARSAGAGI